MARAAAEVAVWTVLLTALELVFISTVTLLETAVAVGLALAAALCARAVRRVGGARLGGGRGAVAALWAWPWTLLTDTACLVTALCHPARRGSFRVLVLHRRTGPAWAALALSATPGSYTLASRRSRMLVHTLPGAEEGALERVLTAGQLQAGEPEPEVRS